jgi:hypothetical protein
MWIGRLLAEYANEADVYCLEMGPDIAFIRFFFWFVLNLYVIFIS